MALEEAAAWLDGDLVLPINGKKYRVPEYSAEIGMRVEAILAAGRGQAGERHKQVLDDEQEKDLYRDVLGPAYEQLLADVSWPMLKHCAVMAMFHFNISPEAGEAHWNRGAQSGKAVSRSSRPATSRTTAAARTTKKPASGSGTSRRRSS